MHKGFRTPKHDTTQYPGGTVGTHCGDNPCGRFGFLKGFHSFIADFNIWIKLQAAMVFFVEIGSTKHFIAIILPWECCARNSGPRKRIISHFLWISASKGPLPDSQKHQVRSFPFWCCFSKSAIRFSLKKGSDPSASASSNPEAPPPIMM